MKKLIELVFTFFKIGLFTFGGGYAMLPLLHRDVVDKKKWLTENELIDLYAIAQSTPGIIAINTATFVGYRQLGILGAVCTTAGFVLPSLVIIIIIAALFQNFGSNTYVVKAFAGIRIVVVALIIKALFRIAKRSITGIITIIIAVSVFVLVSFVNVNPLLIIVGAVFLGLFFLPLWSRE